MRQKRTLSQRQHLRRIQQEQRHKAPETMSLDLVHDGDVYVASATNPIGGNGVNQRGVLLRKGTCLLEKEVFV